MVTSKDAIMGATKREIYHAGRLKTYRDGSFELMVCNRPIFRESGWEERYEKPLGQHQRNEEEAEAADAVQAAEAVAETAENQIDDSINAREDAGREANRARAARRAAGRVRDLALANDFRYFVTLTLDQTMVDRYDMKLITKKLNNWLDNQVRRNGLIYVLVPERHKDGAIHFHGLINEIPGFVSSGTWKVPGHKKPMKPRSQRQAAEWAAQGAENGFHEVYNINGWHLGFSTAIKLYGDYGSAVSYVCKYIRKQTCGLDGKIGGRWFLSGGKLEEPVVELLDLGLQELYRNPALYQFEIPDAGLMFGILRGGNFSCLKNEFTIAGLLTPSENQGGAGPEGPGSPGAPM